MNECRLIDPVKIGIRPDECGEFEYLLVLTGVFLLFCLVAVSTFLRRRWHRRCKRKARDKRPSRQADA